MKKLMIAAFAVAFATVAQAVSVNWYAGELLAPGVNGGWGEDLISGEGYTAQLLVSMSVTGNATDGYALGDLVTFTSGDTSTTVEDGYMYNSTVGGTIPQEDGKFYAQLILTKGDYTLESQIVQINTSAMSSAVEPYFGPTDASNINALPGMQLDATYGAFSKDGWQSVPEPTSGLLLLLGVAGLALKRKRA